MDEERRKKLVKVNFWKKKKEWAKNVAVKYEVLLDPEKDADVIAYMKSRTGAKSSAIKAMIRYYMKTHTPK